ncbi:uncharacterized protein EI90DRAFT_3018693 [Cantharellus anzutake]|uniref:uncharacterized protein n=1 Tax=Cantharellus anzutake TaxID=1750568 RepID=UPI001906936D|nr:uncharacterized protein EI90DRAFT_3018693 [Cantharellus anzutake]KAF8326403.1 hypothetical protein EI90DRAFT_3018693 [Cantharellus anzutake]
MAAVHEEFGALHNSAGEMKRRRVKKEAVLDKTRKSCFISSETACLMRMTIPQAITLIVKLERNSRIIMTTMQLKLLRGRDAGRGHDVLLVLEREVDELTILEKKYWPQQTVDLADEIFLSSLGVSVVGVEERPPTEMVVPQIMAPPHVFEG